VMRTMTASFKASLPGWRGPRGEGSPWLVDVGGWRDRTDRLGSDRRGPATRARREPSTVTYGPSRRLSLGLPSAAGRRRLGRRPTRRPRRQRPCPSPRRWAGNSPTVTVRPTVIRG
jgi:hypothetical protein